MAAHITGLWSVFGGSDHQGYYVTAFSLGAAALVCAAPLVLPASFLYLVLRARVRGTWNAGHATHGVPAVSRGERAPIRLTEWPLGRASRSFRSADEGCAIQGLFIERLLLLRASAKRRLELLIGRGVRGDTNPHVR